MAKVIIETENGVLTRECAPGTALRDVLTAAGVYLDAPCGGNGTCGKCRVEAGGALSPAGTAEREKLGGRGGRLACMARVEGDCRVRASRGERDMEICLSGEGPQRRLPGGGRGLGAAVDIGTTTVVCYLFDLASGEILGARGALNLQRSFGADVISRIGACVGAPAAAAEQTRLIRSQIRELLELLCAGAGRDKGEIVRFAAAGNTAMCHLFAGLDPSCLAALPFEPASLFGGPVSVPELGLPGAEVFVLPAVSAFVGGDITAAALAAELDRRPGITVLADIGTNGEIVLAAGGELYCCATAAGPAFEGAGISCGMGGSEGAICAVTAEAGRPVCRTVKDAPPRGVCGSGLVDAAAVMLELGALEPTGRLPGPDETEADPELVTEEAGETFFTLAPGVRLSGRDVRQIQLAKAAVAGGILTLLDKAGVRPDRVDRMLIAGGFGSRIRAASAGRIGLIPAKLARCAEAVGNAAGEGACLAAASDAARARAGALARRMRYVDLSSDADFMEHYVEEMFFGDEA